MKTIRARVLSLAAATVLLAACGGTTAGTGQAAEGGDPPPTTAAQAESPQDADTSSDDDTSADGSTGAEGSGGSDADSGSGSGSSGSDASGSDGSGTEGSGSSGSGSDGPDPDESDSAGSDDGPEGVPPGFPDDFDPTDPDALSQIENLGLTPDMESCLMVSMISLSLMFSGLSGDTTQAAENIAQLDEAIAKAPAEVKGALQVMRDHLAAVQGKSFEEWAAALDTPVYLAASEQLDAWIQRTCADMEP